MDSSRGEGGKVVVGQTERNERRTQRGERERRERERESESETTESERGRLRGAPAGATEPGLSLLGGRTGPWGGGAAATLASRAVQVEP